MNANRRRYLVSLAEELRAQANRVRDLIGAAHWLSDGHHKEALLIGLLRRHLPSHLLIGRGFVISPHAPDSSSTEQDVLIIDPKLEPPILNQGDLLISFPSSVLASISVKTAFDKDDIVDSVKGLRSVRDACRDDAPVQQLWCGAFFYGEPGATTGTTYNNISTAISQCPIASPILHGDYRPVGPDLFCSSGDFAFRIDHDHQSLPPSSERAFRIRGFSCSGLATAVLLGSLLDHVAQVQARPGSGMSTLLDDTLIRPLEQPEVICPNGGVSP